MSDYSKITNFLSKDSLSLNDPAKYVKGSEIDAEYNAIAVAVATKANTDSPTLTTPTLGVATATSLQAIIGNVTPAAGTFTALTATGAFTSLGLDDNATAKALTLSGSGANSVTIANSATNPTIGTSAGALLLAPATGFVQLNGATTSGLLLNAATGNSALVAMYVNGTEVARIIAGAAENLLLGTSSTGTTQVSVTHTASADRYITLTGSAGGNPTIGVSAGNLAISCPVVVSPGSGNTFQILDGFLDVAGRAQVLSSMALPAGGGTGVVISATTSNIGIYFGSGAPTVSAAKGSIYLRSDGSATNNRMYVNTDGSTTWTAVTTAA